VRSLFKCPSRSQTVSQQAENTAKRQAERSKAFIAPEEEAAPGVKEKRKKKRKRDEMEE
jgi:ribosomal RNA assembly protein